MKLNFRLWITVIVSQVLCPVVFPLTAQEAGAPKWTITDSFHSARIGHTATLLPNGRVLIVGGYGGSQELANAELYEPDNSLFVNTGSLDTPRTNHTATLLPDGQVLVVGGQFQGSTLASAELYNPSTGVWTQTGRLHIARSYHTATLLSDGEVLVAGGTHWASPPVFAQGAPPGSALDVAELYDPATGKWTVTDSMHTARYVHTATLLDNGDVLVTGGIGSRRPGNISLEDHARSQEDFYDGGRLFGEAVCSAELFDHKNKTWVVTSNLLNARYNHTATLLPNGDVLVAGGTNGNIMANAEIYSVSNRTWMPTGSLQTMRNGHTATLLSNGQVLVTGGANNSGVLTSAELFNPTTGSWQATSNLNVGRALHTATLLTDGKMLVAGGFYAVGAPSYSLASAELWESADKAASTVSQNPSQKNAVTSSLDATLARPASLITMAGSLVIFTICLVIITACVVVLLATWLVFVLVQRWCK